MVKDTVFEQFIQNYRFNLTQNTISEVWNFTSGTHFTLFRGNRLTETCKAIASI